MRVTFKCWEGIVFLCCLRLTGVRVINTKGQEEATWCKLKMLWSRTGKRKHEQSWSFISHSCSWGCPPWCPMSPLSLSCSLLNRVINNQPIWTRPRVRWAACNGMVSPVIDSHSTQHHYNITTQTRRLWTRMARLHPYKFHDGCRQVCFSQVSSRLSHFCPLGTVKVPT